MSETKQSDTSTKKTEDKPALQSFYVGKYDVTVQAANAQEAVELAKKQSKKEDK